MEYLSPWNESSVEPYKIANNLSNSLQKLSQKGFYLNKPRKQYRRDALVSLQKSQISSKNCNLTVHQTNLVNINHEFNSFSHQRQPLSFKLQRGTVSYIGKKTKMKIRREKLTPIMKKYDLFRNPLLQATEKLKIREIS